MIDIDELKNKANKLVKQGEYSSYEILNIVACLSSCSDALNRLQSENKSLRNELCQRCGRYIDEHNGSCNSCKWRKTHD